MGGFMKMGLKEVRWKDVDFKCLWTPVKVKWTFRFYKMLGILQVVEWCQSRGLWSINLVNMAQHTAEACYRWRNLSHLTSAFIVLLLPMKRYNLYKVLACSAAFFQLSLFCATFFQLRTFVLLISSKMSSSQHVLRLPIGLLDMGFYLLIWTFQHGLTSLIFVF
jgi:hypothetical protein